MNEKRPQNNGTEKPLTARTTDELIDLMREEDDAAEREKILRTMTPACRKKLRYFETWLRKEVDHTLRRRYELGLEVLELYEDERKNGGKLYGKNAIGRICKLLRWDDGVIRFALRFVRAFSREDLERLCALVLPTGEPLTWSHVRALLAVNDASRRQDLLRRTAEEGWSCTELAQAIVRREDRPAGDKRGRPPRVPKDFDGAVAQQQESAEQWDRRYTRVWAKQEGSLVTQAANLPAEEVTEQRLRRARELAVQLRRVANQALAQAERAEQVVRDFERILSERQLQGKSAEPGSTAARNSA
jgi:hypothetical protein